MLVAAQSKERELKLKERAAQLETNEKSLRETHSVVEHRLGLSETKMSDMLTQLKTSKANVAVLEKHQKQHTSDIARYQLYISELEIQKDTYYNNYNQLLTEVEEKETKRKISHQEEIKEKDKVKDKQLKKYYWAGLSASHFIWLYTAERDRSFHR